MAKIAKKTQTDFTRGGRDISNTAIPLYQENLTRIGNYLDNPQARVDDYLNRYFTNTASQNDFLRNYQRSMSGMTANNYGATHGGYSSANQMNYDDQQRYMNDLASRLREQGVTSAYNMASGDYANMLSGNTAFQNAYALGQPYSDVEQYNYLAKQNNSFGNQLAGLGSTVGNVLQAIPLPQTQAIGGALSTIGSMGSIDTSNALGTLGVKQAEGAGNVGQGYLNANQSALLGNALQDIFKK